MAKDYNDYSEVDSYTPPLQDIRQEGDFFVHKILLTAYNGKTYDVTFLRMQLSIYEDIYQNAIQAGLLLYDASDVQQFFPVIGEEKLEVVFTRPDESGKGLLEEDYVQKFRLVSVHSRQPDFKSENVQMYELRFVSEEYWKQSQNKVSLAYRGMLYSDIVGDLFTLYGKIDKDIVCETSAYPQDIAFASYTPFDCIQQCAMRAISAETGVPGYVFFEDMEAFRFTTISKLIQQASVRTYNYKPANILDDSRGVKEFQPREIEQDIYRVEFFKFAHDFDIIKNINSGLYGTKLVTVDFIRQVWEEYEFTLDKEYEKFAHLEGNTPYVAPPFKPMNHLKCVTTNKDHDVVGWIAAREKILPHHIEEWIYHRYAQLMLINNKKLQITVSGDPRRHAGQVIEFYPPNFYGAFDQQRPQDPPYDRYLSGKFLITSCKHRLAYNKYYNDIEIVKDSLLEGIEHVDPIEQQKFSY